MADYGSFVFGGGSSGGGGFGGSYVSPIIPTSSLTSTSGLSGTGSSSSIRDYSNLTDPNQLAADAYFASLAAQRAEQTAMANQGTAIESTNPYESNVRVLDSGDEFGVYTPPVKTVAQPVQTTGQVFGPFNTPSTGGLFESPIGPYNSPSTGGTIPVSISPTILSAPSFNMPSMSLATATPMPTLGIVEPSSPPVVIPYYPSQPGSLASQVPLAPKTPEMWSAPTLMRTGPFLAPDKPYTDTMVQKLNPDYVTFMQNQAAESKNIQAETWWNSMTPIERLGVGGNAVAMNLISRPIDYLFSDGKVVPFSTLAYDTQNQMKTNYQDHGYIGGFADTLLQNQAAQVTAQSYLFGAAIGYGSRLVPGIATVGTKAPVIGSLFARPATWTAEGVAKGAGYGMIGYGAYSMGEKVYTGDYKGAATEGALFIASLPYGVMGFKQGFGSGSIVKPSELIIQISTPVKSGIGSFFESSKRMAYDFSAEVSAVGSKRQRTILTAPKDTLYNKQIEAYESAYMETTFPTRKPIDVDLSNEPLPETIDPLEPWYGKSVEVGYGGEFNRVGYGGSKSRVVLSSDLIELKPLDLSNPTQVKDRNLYDHSTDNLVTPNEHLVEIPRANIPGEKPFRFDNDPLQEYPYGRFSKLSDRLVTPGEDLIEIPKARIPTEPAGKSGIDIYGKNQEDVFSTKESFSERQARLENLPSIDMGNGLRQIVEMEHPIQKPLFSKMDIPNPFKTSGRVAYIPVQLDKVEKDRTNTRIYGIYKSDTSLQDDFFRTGIYSPQDSKQYSFQKSDLVQETKPNTSQPYRNKFDQVTDNFSSQSQESPQEQVFKQDYSQVFKQGQTQLQSSKQVQDSISSQGQVQSQSFDQTFDVSFKQGQVQPQVFKQIQDPVFKQDQVQYQVFNQVHDSAFKQDLQYKRNTKQSQVLRYKPLVIKPLLTVRKRKKEGPDDKSKKSRPKRKGNPTFWNPAGYENVTLDEFQLPSGERALHIGSRRQSNKLLGHQLRGSGSIPTLRQYNKQRRSKRK